MLEIMSRCFYPDFFYQISITSRYTGSLFRHRPQLSEYFDSFNKSCETATSPL
jgi:hypothetical protein